MADDSTERVRMILDIPKEVHQTLQMKASLLGLTPTQFVMGLIEQAKVPNTETIRAIEETDRGENVLRFDNVDDFLRYLRDPNE
jgi:antitoxin component of RelBE/YafQ-DinJ toxin-antitoxin module